MLEPLPSGPFQARILPAPRNPLYGF
jgi:hypothetical protein